MATRTVFLVSTAGCSVKMDDDGITIQLSEAVLEAKERFIQAELAQPGDFLDRRAVTVQGVGLGSFALPFFAAAQFLARCDGILGVKLGLSRGSSETQEQWLQTCSSNRRCIFPGDAVDLIHREASLRSGCVSAILAEPEPAEWILDRAGLPNVEELTAQLRQRGFVELTFTD